MSGSLRTTLFDPATGRVSDNIRLDGRINRMAPTCNQGTFVGAANLLDYHGEAKLAATFTTNELCRDGYFPRAGEKGDGGGCNGIGARWIARFMKDWNEQSTFEPWLQKNAEAAWQARRASDNLTLPSWPQPIPEGVGYSWGSSSKVMVLQGVRPPGMALGKFRLEHGGSLLRWGALFMSEPSPEFPATRWSLIQQVRCGDSAASADALDKLCRTYWRPLYAYARWWGASPESAPDMVQGFLGNFIARGDLIRSTPGKGRFRAYLLGAFQNYLVSERRREQAEKRGGAFTFVSLGEARMEDDWCLAAREMGPEEAYDRRWAEEVMRLALAQVEGDYRRAGNEATFAVLVPALTAVGEDFETLGVRMGVSAGGARSAMHRMRLKLREALRGEIAQTVAAPEDLQDEMRYLLGLLAS